MLARLLLRLLVLLLLPAFVVDVSAQSTNAPTRHHSPTSTHKKSNLHPPSGKTDADTPDKPESPKKSDTSDAPPTPSPIKSTPPTDDSSSKPAPQKTGLQGPIVATIDPSDLADFSSNSPAIQKLITDALTLTKKNLGYLYGSADPSQPGMDCSGTVYYLLQQQGLKGVPRSSDEQYVWVRKAGDFRAVESSKLDSFEFNELKPGDLLFWEGTYSIQRDIPVTHSMIYLGKAKADGLPLMVGASDGRSYRGKKCYGVSVFDFKLPAAGSKSRFIGYAHLPWPAAAQQP